MPYKVIILAAGQGKRMGAGKNKLFLELNGKPVLIHTLNVFQQDEQCEGIILAIHPRDEQEYRELFTQYKIDKVLAMIPGGKERQDSVYNTLITFKSEEIVLVHDAARPFIDHTTIHRLVDVALETDAAIVAVPVKDTIKRVRLDEIVDTVERSSLWAAQTPQAFRMSLLNEAHQKAKQDQFIGTDDASLVERLHKKVSIVEGTYDNIKLTTPEDLYFAEAIIRKRQGNG